MPTARTNGTIAGMNGVLEADRLIAGLGQVGTTSRSPKIRYTHEAMCDLIVGNPWISQNEIAEYFGYSVGWISQIITSDAFQSRLAERRVEIIDPELKATVEERFKAMVLQSIAVVQAKLSRPVDQVPNSLALKAMELGAKALGVGGNAAPAVHQDPNARLEELGKRLEGLIQRKRIEGGVIDGQAHEIEDVLPLSTEVRG